MSSHDKEDSTWVIGALIGGVVGIGALTFYIACRKQQQSPLHTIGKVIGHIGEIFESEGVQEPTRLKDVERKIHRHEDTISDVVEWVAIGVKLWKKFQH